MREVTLNYNQVISHCKRKKNRSFPLITIEVKQRKKAGGSKWSSEAIRVKYRIILETKHSYPLLPNPLCCQCAESFLWSQSEHVGQKHDLVSLWHPCTSGCPGLLSQNSLPSKHSPNTALWVRGWAQHSQLQYPTSLELWETPSFTVSTVCSKINT